MDFIVHVFSAEKRAFYGLERLRKSATTLSVDDLNAEIKQHIASARQKKAPAKKSVAKKSVARKSPAKKSAKRSTR